MAFYLNLYFFMFTLIGLYLLYDLMLVSYRDKCLKEEFFSNILFALLAAFFWPIVVAYGTRVLAENTRD